MATTNLNNEEIKVLFSIRESAKKEGDSGIEFLFSSLHVDGLNKKQLKGYVSQLQQKRYIDIYEKGQYYFTGEILNSGFEALKQFENEQLSTPEVKVEEVTADELKIKIENDILEANKMGVFHWYGDDANKLTKLIGKKASEAFCKKMDKLINPAIPAPAKVKASTKKASGAQPITETVKTTAHKVGDIHKNGKWFWTEYKPGKFDWRNIKVK